MCGIWFYLRKNEKHWIQEEDLYKAFTKISHRGPDRSIYEKVNDYRTMYVGFHRLAIMDKGINGDQPFKIQLENRIIYCICNGEIYNYIELTKKHDLSVKSKSDCEVIPHMYIKYGIDFTTKALNGEFSFILVDVSYNDKTIKLISCSDRFGIRPLFYGEDDNGICFSSEKKGFLSTKNSHIIANNIKHFPPGHYLTYNLDFKEDMIIEKDLVRYYSHTYDKIKITTLEDAYKQIYSTMMQVAEMMMNDVERPIGVCLSGGLDSSLLASILAKIHKRKFGIKLRSFSIGMKGSTDEYYARKVAEHIDSKHTHFEETNETFLDFVLTGKIVWITGTFDTTTNRASVGQALLSQRISETTDIKILFVGDGSDEITGGYIENHKAPNPKEFHEWGEKRMREIHEYDVRRADRCICYYGMESRVIFLNHLFVDMYKSIDPKLRMPTDGMEKWLLRKSFEKYNLLPHDVLFRRKEAFSDGVSSVEDSWHSIIQSKIEKMYSNDDLLNYQKRITFHPPKTKEELFFRDMYERFYGSNDICESIEFGYWKFNEKWVGETKEVSARGLIDIY